MYVSLLSISTRANEIPGILETYKKCAKSLGSGNIQNITQNLIVYHEDNDRFFPFYKKVMDPKSMINRLRSKINVERNNFLKKLLYVDFLIRSKDYEQALNELESMETKLEADKVNLHARKATIYYLLNDKENFELHKEKVYQYSSTLIVYRNLKLLEQHESITYDPINQEIYTKLELKVPKKQRILIYAVFFGLVLILIYLALSARGKTSVIDSKYTEFETISREIMEKDEVEIGAMFDTKNMHIALLEAYDYFEDDDEFPDGLVKTMRQTILGIVYVDDENRINKYSFKDINLFYKEEDPLLIPVDGYTVVIKDIKESEDINQLDYKGESYSVQTFKATKVSTITGEYGYFAVALVEGKVDNAKKLHFY